jgi:chromosome transmission fidelity protein 4
MVGVMEVTEQDTHHIVNVEFRDRSTRKSYHFTDYFKYDMASLGEFKFWVNAYPSSSTYCRRTWGTVRCPPDKEHPTHVIYKPYDTWATQGEWTYDLPEGVKAVGLAAGGPPPRKTLRSEADADI